MPTKSTEHTQLKQRGQLSIFLGICFVIIMTLMAFVVNVGLFVKAKINLQNAVDAAAFSGAATQARQLTNISYLNWEIRNVYKEWMFKYYILGQLSLRRADPYSTASINGSPPSGTQPDYMNFRREQFWGPGQPNYDSTLFDAYSSPNICIHFGGNHNVCSIYTIPGLPRFNTPGLPGIDEEHTEFMHNIVKKKAEDCSSRSDINFMTTMTWAYGVGDGTTFADAPQIAASRPGAWTQAIELALRMRNLEMMVNRPPVENMCNQDGGNCNKVSDLNQLNAEDMPHNERPVKAFWSAYRNLGNDSGASEMQASFELSELAPRPFVARAQTVSSYLIPPGANNAITNGNPLEKFYLDLMIVPVNLATFFTTFVSTADNIDGVPAEARCAGSQVALPVPSYIMGFVKNPEVLTYYAVKGSAKHIGLFFPFTEQEGIKLTAYAAAKPYGGRIGPKLFGFDPDQKAVVPRAQSSDVFRSYAYFNGFDVASIFNLPNRPTPATNYKPGDPVPLTPDFWINNVASSTAITIGGSPDANSGALIKFGIPNIIYDFIPGEMEDHKGAASESIFSIRPANTDTQARQNSGQTAKTGLYKKDQYRSLHRHLPNNYQSGNMSPAMIEESIIRARMPTKYDALNYLIPTFGNGNIDTIDSVEEIPADSGPIAFNSIPVSGGANPGYVVYKLYAPLFGTSTLYPNPVAVESIVSDYLASSERAIESFMDALLQVADSIYNEPTQEGEGYKKAASALHTEANSPPGSGSSMAAKCEDSDGDPSLAGKLLAFLLPGSTSNTCGIKPLDQRLKEYWNSRRTDLSFKNYLVTTYALPTTTAGDPISPAELMTGYMPGPRHGADQDGRNPHPFGLDPGQIPLSRRNYYSTKFIAMNKLFLSGGSPYVGQGAGGGGEISPFMEGDRIGDNPSDVADGGTLSFENPLDRSFLSEFQTVDF